MAEIIIDYSALEDAKASAKKIVTGWNGIDDYKSGLNNKLKDSISESRLSKSEPYNHSYIANAQQDISAKVTQLNTVRTQWIDLSSTIDTFINYVKEREDKVVSIFRTTSSQYTDYSGLDGVFNYISDGLYNIFCVDLVNSNSFTRKIADFGKVVSDDLSYIKKQVTNYFQHGNGRYFLNIYKSIGLTLIALAGVAVSVIALPFTGGASCTMTVACLSLLGLAASGIGAGIQVYNTKKTIDANTKALRMSEDPGTARFYGDITSFSDYAKKTDLGSKEKNEKAAKKGRILDITEGVCTILSMATGFVNSVGTSSVELVDDAGNVVKHTSLDFSKANVKKNVLNTFGVKADKQTSTIDTAGASESITISNADEIGETTIEATRSTQNVRYRSAALETNTSVDANGENTVKRVAKFKRTDVTTEYESLVASNNIETREFSRYASHAESSTTSIDYTDAFTSADRMNELDMQGDSKIVKIIKTIDNKGEDHIEWIENLQNGEEESLSEKIYDKFKDNYFVNQMNEYGLSYSKDDGFTIFGSKGSELVESWQAITGAE